ncbi:hypothetical protein Salat_1099000 [Sesamum alatum]|uniref:Uncharacterized protein n=1 Tax=Sesamum alatum TaxID=300844 RepID=A0AAE2CSY6_9LAMI|nr:hypothetical protein Salat_1099000 [Sesamum alatum]
MEWETRRTHEESFPSLHVLIQIGRIEKSFAPAPPHPSPPPSSGGRRKFSARPQPRSLLSESPSDDLYSQPARVFVGSATRRHSKPKIAIFAQKSPNFRRLFSRRFLRHSDELPTGVHTIRILTSSRTIPFD